MKIKLSQIRQLIRESLLDSVESPSANYFQKSFDKFSAGKNAIKQIRNIKDAAKIIEDLFIEIKELNPEIDLEMLAKLILRNEQSKKTGKDKK